MIAIKQEKNNNNSPVGSSKTGIKILNDEQLPVLPLPGKIGLPENSASTMNVSIAKPKDENSPTKRKKTDHYVIQGDADEAGSSVINLILNDSEEENVGQAIHLREELQLNSDEEEEVQDGKELVEHVCGKCYKTFRRFSGLKKHLDFCRFYSGYHLRKAEMMKNLDKIEKDAVIMENKDICFCCAEGYDTFHLGHISCPDCPKSFKTQTSYERHIFITHSESDEFPCTVCNAKLRTGNLLKLHIEQHKNRGKPWACKICGKDFTRPYHLKRHQKYSACAGNEHDTMSCKVCNKTFYRLDNLRAHLKQHLGTHVTKKREYMCPICKNCFYSLSTLNIHTRTHTGERPFDCDLCEKKFPSLVALKKHRRYHTGEKPYTCTVCNQSFAVKEVLNRHMKRHTGERPHVCAECGKSFIQATQLRSHARVHIRPFECEDCDEKFKTEKQLDRHSKGHRASKRATKNKPKRATRRSRHDCAICNKNFDTVQNLKFHILKEHELDAVDVLEKNSSQGLPAPKIYTLKPSNENENAPTPSNVVTTDNAADGSVVVQEFMVDELPQSSITATPVSTTFIPSESFTVIPLDSVNILDTFTIDGVPVVPDSMAVALDSTAVVPAEVKNENTKSPKKEIKNEPKKTLAQSLAAAIADDVDAVLESLEELTEEDKMFRDKVRKLLDMLVDKSTLKQFGWPHATEEMTLCKVIENCGYDLTEDRESLKDCDYATRMREYVKLLLTVVIHNDSIKELLNNYLIDEVIGYVLDEDDDNDDEDEDAKIEPEGESILS